MSKKILIVDDDVKDLKVIRNILKKEGYKVTTSSNGKKAIELIKKDCFNLVLIDILMPTLSGYDMMVLLREKLKKNIKLVYISIVPKKEVDLKKVNGFIQKPFSEQSLINGVKKVIGK